MFNGKDLTGWQGDPQLWSVRDGCILGRDLKGSQAFQNKWLIWQGGEPGDFEIEFECKVTRGANTGLQFRSQRTSNLNALTGYQADIDGGLADVTGNIFEEGGRGTLARKGDYSIFRADGLKSTKVFDSPAELKASFNPIAWNRFRIIARGHTVLCFVNDRLMSKVLDEYEGNKARSGLIGLHTHVIGNNLECQFKNMRIRNLPPENVDLFTVGSAWESQTLKRVLTVTKRDGQAFTAKFELARPPNRLIRGQVTGESVVWLAKDVKSDKGAPTANHYCTIVPDPEGDRLILVLQGADEKKGSWYEMRRVMK